MERSREDVHNYWRDPDEINRTETYLASGIGRSIFLLSNMQRLAMSNSRILEIGCNAGRNLACLWHGGFKKLRGVEINKDAVEKLRLTFPELQRVKIDVGPIEEKIVNFKNDSFDVVFTMAVLEHLHWDSSFIFEEMKRISTRIIVVEDEETNSERHFPRNYQKVFESLGMQQIEYLARIPDLPRKFRYRVFDRYPSIPRTQQHSVSTLWKPISSAPKTGEVIISSDGLSISTIFWSVESSSWICSGSLNPFFPTHWDRMPPLPAKTNP